MNALLAVSYVLGRLLVIFSVTYLLPIASAIYYGDGTLETFFVSLLACVAAGALLMLVTSHFRRELQARDGFILVTLAWALTAAIAAVPLMLHQQLSFTDAFFETMSGLTTTGATVMVGLDPSHRIAPPCAALPFRMMKPSTTEPALSPPWK